MNILIGAPVRQDEETFKYYLESLDNLELPKGAEVTRFFFLHNSPHLVPLVQGYSYGTYESEDDYPRDNITHHWKRENLARVTWMKNALLKLALDEGFDYFFLVDSDLILHPKTLVQLVAADKPIIAEAFWTRWKPDEPEGPNAWMLDQATSYHDSYDTWRKPGLYPVGMSGACILIKREVLAAGVNYTPIHNLSFWGEDRAFCIRAAVHGYQVWLDTHYPALHLYRESDLEGYRNGARP